MSIRPFVLSALAIAAIAACKKKQDPPKPTPAPADCTAADAAFESCRAALEGCQADFAECGHRAAEACPPRETDAPYGGPPEREAVDEPKTGATYVLGQGNRTVVMNPRPVEDGLRRFAKGSVCRFDPEGTVVIVGKRLVKDEDETYPEYLVRYTRDAAPEALQVGSVDPYDSEPYECPSGTVFFLDDVGILEVPEEDPRYGEAKKLLDSEKP